MNQSVLYSNQTSVQQNSGPAEMHFCFKCRWEGRTANPICPRCLRGLYSRRNVRMRGVALTLLGLFLTGLMAAVTIFVTGLLLNAANNPKTAPQFNGTELMLGLIYIVFGGLIATGLIITLAGLWQIVFGRRNMVLIWLFIGLTCATVCVGMVFSALAG